MQYLTSILIFVFTFTYYSTLDNDIISNNVYHNVTVYGDIYIKTYITIYIDINNDIHSNIALYTNINNLNGLRMIAGFALLQLWPQLEYSLQRDFVRCILTINVTRCVYLSYLKLLDHYSMINKLYGLYYHLSVFFLSLTHTHNTHTHTHTHTLTHSHSLTPPYVPSSIRSVFLEDADERRMMGSGEMKLRKMKVRKRKTAYVKWIRMVGTKGIMSKKLQ